MLDIIMIILIIFTILLTLYAVEEESTAFCIITAILWLITALLIIQGVEIPYEMYNASSGNIETGVHTIQTNLTPLSYLFMGFGAIMFVLSFSFAFTDFMEYKRTKL